MLRAVFICSGVWFAYMLLRLERDYKSVNSNMDVFKCLESHLNDRFKLKWQNLLLKLIHFLSQQVKGQKICGKPQSRD